MLTPFSPFDIKHKNDAKKTSGNVFLGHLRRGSFSYFLQILGLPIPFRIFVDHVTIFNPNGLIRKEKVHIVCEEGAQISIFTNKIAIQWWPNIITKESKQTNFTFIYYFLLIMFTCCWFDQKTGNAFNGSFSFS